MVEVINTNINISKTTQNIRLPDKVHTLKVSTCDDRLVVWINGTEVVINVPLLNGTVYITKE